jgi:hypothetical protein
VTPFSNNYKINDAATSLYTSANIVKAAGYTGTSCAGIYPKGGSGTYYAQVIYAAQAALVAQQAANPGSKNALIILSDGDATATVTYTTPQKTAIATTSQLQPSSTNSLNGVAFNNPTSVTYPSAVGECGQAVIAAQAATQAGTQVFTIGYGAPNSGSCTSDQTYTGSGNATYGGAAWPAASHGGDNGRQSCDSLAAMASKQINFYSDNANSCSAINASNANITALANIFHQITSTLTKPRLIPNNF